MPNTQQHLVVKYRRTFVVASLSIRRLFLSDRLIAEKVRRANAYAIAAGSNSSHTSAQVHSRTQL